MLLWAVATLAGLALVLVAGFYALLWWAYRDSEYVPTKASESATCALLSLQELEDEVGGTASFVDDVGGGNQCGYRIAGSDLGYDARLWTHADSMRDGLTDISVKRIKGGLAEGDASFVEGVGELAAFEEDGTLRFFDDGIEYQVRLAGDSDTSDAAPGVEVATALAKVMLTHA